MEIQPQIIAACSKMLQMSSIRAGDKTIKSSVGVPQGGCLSPSQFNIYINSLIVEMNQQNYGVLAYADDIVIFTKGKAQLTRTLRNIENWCDRSNMQINKEKSGIMQLCLPYDRVKNLYINQYPVVQRYKNLGITLQSNMLTSVDVQNRI